MLLYSEAGLDTGLAGRSGPGLVPVWNLCRVAIYDMCVMCYVECVIRYG